MNTNIFTYAMAAFKRHIIRETGFPSKIDGIPIALFDEAADRFEATLPDQIRRSLNGRFERGLTLAKKGSATAWKGDPHPQYHRLFKVASSDPSRPPYFYKVDIDEDTCECPDFAKGHYCKHIIAAHIRYQAFQLVGAMLVQRSKADIRLPADPPPQPVPAPPPPPVVQPPPALPDPPKAELPLPLADTVIWGMISLEGAPLGVEVLAIQEDGVTVRALPKIVEGRKLQPQFPFTGRRCVAKVRKDKLSHVKIFRR